MFPRQSNTRSDPAATDTPEHSRRNRPEYATMAAMILEHALLDVRPGLEADFESAFARARPLIGVQPGFVSLRLERCVEAPGRYLLLVEWTRLEDHTEGFRRSAEYAQWRELLHHFYDPFPEVTHFEPVIASR